MALSPSLSLLLTAALVASMWCAFTARPRTSPAPRWILATLFTAAVAVYAAAYASALWDWPQASALLAAGGVELVCLAAWLGRAEQREDGGAGTDPADPPPIDWDDFERSLRAYAARRRPRAPLTPR